MQFREVHSLAVEQLLELDEDEAPEMHSLVTAAIVVRDKRKLGAILKQLSNASLPSHLKRLRHVSSFHSSDVDGASSTAHEHALVLLVGEEEIAKFATEYSSDTVPVQVPRQAPLTEQQVLCWSKRYWPVHFSSKQSAPPTLMNDLGGDAAAAIARQWLDQAIKFPVQIVDPRTNQLLAATSMLLSDHDDDDGSSKRNNAVLAHPVMLALQTSASKVQQSTNADDYLCTGMDVFLLHEPCIMCAMALLHSRVSRVFFVHANPTSGALASVCRLHTLPSINHRYRVFHHQQEEEEEEAIPTGGRCFTL